MKYTNKFEIIKRCYNPSIRFICFCYAGGSTAFFRPLAKLLPDDYEVIAFVLPGREKRFNEPMLTDIEDVVCELKHILIESNVPIILFGHSLGALIAFELGVSLQNLGKAVCLVVVSACRSPIDIANRERIADLPDEQLVEKLRSYGGTPSIAFDNPELLQVFLPKLRSDMRILENYQLKHQSVLRCPIIALYGIQDEYVTHDSVANWSLFSNTGFIKQSFEGGHFYLLDAFNVVVKSVLEYMFYLRLDD